MELLVVNEMRLPGFLWNTCGIVGIFIVGMMLIALVAPEHAGLEAWVATGGNLAPRSADQASESR